MSRSTTAAFQALPALFIAFGLVAQDGPAAAPAVQRITLQDAVQAALKNNLQVGIAEQVRDATKAGVLINQGAFDWSLSSGLNFGRTKSARISSQPSQINPGTLVTTDYEFTTTTRNINATVTKPFEWGGNFSIAYGSQSPLYSSTDQSGTISAISSTNQVITTPTPTYITPFPYSSSLSATYTQSLLRNAGRDAASVLLIVAKKGSIQSDYIFQQAIIALVADTESKYWDLVFAKRNLENKRQSLALSQKQLNENQIRVQVGTLAPIEVTSAEASVAQREQDIIAAEAQLDNAKDALARALYPDAGRATNLEAADAPSIEPFRFDESTAEKTALDKRLELKVSRLDLESKQALETSANSKLKPQLDLNVGYIGASNTRDNFSGVNSDLTGFKYPGYNLGLTFSIPFANRAAKGGVSQARANRRQSELSLKDQELGIVLQVRTAYRNLEAAAKGVAAAEKTRIFREKNLDAERKKFDNGMSTNFFVLQRADELDTARSAELQARITYAKNVTTLEQSLGTLLEARKLEVK
ncbi:MAG: TolC family protein [Holophagaceae bacterium]|nr:TolC family protein [Holophagaceae bacterium]